MDGVKQVLATDASRPLIMLSPENDSEPDKEAAGDGSLMFFFKNKKSVHRTCWG
jgi:hypothetical protein